MSFTSTLFNLAERVFQAFIDLGEFFTKERFLDRVLETYEDFALVDIFPKVTNWLLNQFSPTLLEASFAELLLITGVPLIIVFSFCSWLLKTIPIL